MFDAAESVEVLISCYLCTCSWWEWILLRNKENSKSISVNPLQKISWNPGNFVNTCSKQCLSFYIANFLIQSLCCDRAVTVWWLPLDFLVALVKSSICATLIPTQCLFVSLYLDGAHVVTVQLPSRACLVARFSHLPSGSRWPVLLVQGRQCSHRPVVTATGGLIQCVPEKRNLLHPLSNDNIHSNITDVDVWLQMVS